ncbi:leucine-rich repeat domain-containing protein [Methanoculleus bourgensis]|nr:leucine-rich repeat domain-containing protein [Methanoculleus bourgensis]
MKKIDSHTAHGEKRTTFGRLLMCGLIFGMLLSAIPAVVAASEVVTFNDDGLEAAVREALDKSVGDITAEDMAGLTELDASDRGITDLSGLEYAVNLRKLNLLKNQISDLSPLAGLTNLQDLHLGANQISDLKPLADLTKLEWLDLGVNQISNLEPLAGLTNLQTLVLMYNQISNLKPLAGLTNLQTLVLMYNQISNLEPLAGLTNLSTSLNLPHLSFCLTLFYHPFSKPVAATP